MRRSSVDFPQPDGPMSETNAPRAMSMSMPSSATVRLAPRPGIVRPVAVARPTWTYGADDRRFRRMMASVRRGHVALPVMPTSTDFAATEIFDQPIDVRPSLPLSQTIS